MSTINRLAAARRTGRVTAIVIAYDDSDGWYDHVMPPIVNPSTTRREDALTGTGTCGTGRRAGGYQDRCGYGPRLPLLVDLAVREAQLRRQPLTDQTSIIRFVEDNWSLGRIGDAVVRRQGRGAGRHVRVQRPPAHAAADPEPDHRRDRPPLTETRGNAWGPARRGPRCVVRANPRPAHRWVYSASLRHAHRGGVDPLEGRLENSDAAWIGDGFAAADGGGLLLLITTIIANIAVRRGPDTGLGKLAKVGASLSFVLIAIYVFAVWAMTTKPS